MDLDSRIKAIWNQQVLNYRSLRDLTGMGDPFLDVRLRLIKEQPWLNYNQKVFTDSFGKTDLRMFKLALNSDRSLLLVMPEAGHNGHIGDYADGQSLVRTARESFDGNVYLLDKRPARPEHVGYDLDDCIDSLAQAVSFIGHPVDLVGLCQGGSQAAIYAALQPKSVRSLTLLASPIDFHADDGISVFPRQLGLEPYRQMVSAHSGLMPGSLIVSGFMMMDPMGRFFEDDANLRKAIDENDQPTIQRWKNLFDWYYGGIQPLPGAMYLELVERLFIENRLVQGKLEVTGRQVNLSDIDCPVFRVAGKRDGITPPAQLNGVALFRNAPPPMVVNQGHVGVFIARKLQPVYRDHFDALGRIWA